MNWANCNPSSSSAELNPDFYAKLRNLEVLCGFELFVNSAFRPVDHEKGQGRSGTSSHCKGLAVDLRCSDSRRRAIIVSRAFQLGFRRIGIYKTFIHLDVDYDKVYPCIWLG